MAWMNGRSFGRVDGMGGWICRHRGAHALVSSKDVEWGREVERRDACLDMARRAELRQLEDRTYLAWLHPSDIGRDDGTGIRGGYVEQTTRVAEKQKRRSRSGAERRKRECIS
jgi:hypothetical protein